MNRLTDLASGLAEIVAPLDENELEDDEEGLSDLSFGDGDDAVGCYSTTVRRPPIAKGSPCIRPVLTCYSTTGSVFCSDAIAVEAAAAAAAASVGRRQGHYRTPKI